MDFQTPFSFANLEHILFKQKLKIITINKKEFIIGKNLSEEKCEFAIFFNLMNTTKFFTA